MSNTPVGSIRQLLPHWIAMFLLMMLILQLVELSVGEMEFLPSLGIVFAVALTYPTLVRAIGIAPAAWQR